MKIIGAFCFGAGFGGFGHLIGGWLGWVFAMLIAVGFIIYFND